jgi:lipoyl-dependent peroxiredoxin
MSVRKASAVWKGNLKEGNGTLSSGSGVLSNVAYNFRQRFGEDPGTNPEELVAAAHAACFSMAFSSRLAKNGTPATKLAVRVEITFDNSGGGWKVARSHIRVRGDVPGIDEAKFVELAEDAKENCPISAAIKGNVELDVEAALVEPGHAGDMPTGHLVGTS